MSGGHHIQRPRWSPEFSWNGVAAVVALLTFLVGGLSFLWVASSAWAAVQADVITVKQVQIEMKTAAQTQRQELEAEIQDVRQGTERRLGQIHKDVQDIKNILIADRRRD